ncbi:PAP2 domain protein [Myxozyma melibiosi]|uniref:PAP2 domain protein n=1 Tax=Myxozyma melibiosi TaxID=54550 RepID=A0ABR1EY80_9ASCO
MARRKASQFRIAFSYVFDYALCIVLIGVWSYIATFEPSYSRFSLSDITLQYPIADPETVPYGLAVVYSIIVPLAVIVLWPLVVDHFRYHSSFSSRLWDVNAGILGLLLSEAITLVITTSLKEIVGRPRPDAIARCMPEDGATDASPYGLSDITVCTQPDKDILAEGFRSWPSGHSSTAFAGLGYLSFYLAGKLSLYDNKGEVWKATAVMFPFLGAAAIATSRVKDHRHHGTDVLTGSIMGFVIAWMSYRMYFPSLNDTAREGRAWSIRSWGEAKVSPEIVEPEDEIDEEERIALANQELRRRQVAAQRNGNYDYDPRYSQSAQSYNDETYDSRLDSASSTTEHPLRPQITTESDGNPFEPRR